jgi:CelD/BcsL family acetyltransferase involved in cellulose biosynthesis
MTTLPDAPIASQGPVLPVTVARFDDIARADWDRLFRVTTSATPFSSWTVHRAWWDAYSNGAEPHYLLVGADPIRGIVPLMARSSPGATGRTIYLAATYHVDYATALAADGDIETVARACLEHFSRDAAHPNACTIDLRRLRADDAFLAQLHLEAGRRAGESGWTVHREREDVCPVVELADDWSLLLAGLGKKTRHEVRRKLRRAQAQGPLRLRYAPLDAATAGRFIDLHQARWGAAGLFTDTDDGRRSGRFLHRLVELEAAEGERARFHIGEVVVGDRAIYMLAGFASGATCYFYNAGMDTAALELSPGVVGTALYLRDRIDRGDKRFDFLRGDEPYKYEWGAADEVVCRLLITPRGAK